MKIFMHTFGSYPKIKSSYQVVQMKKYPKIKSCILVLILSVHAFPGNKTHGLDVATGIIYLLIVRSS